VTALRPYIMQRRIQTSFFGLLIISSSFLARAQSNTEATSPRAPFVKKLTLETFGYDLSPSGFGYDSRAPLLSGGAFTAHGLECPYCAMIPLMNRGRQTLQPFGAIATYRPFGSRVELFTGFGGLEAWMPDGAMRTGQRSSTYNDSWLLQAQAGMSVAIDRKQRVRVGIVERYLQQTGAREGLRSHWNTFEGNATYSFGR